MTTHLPPPTGTQSAHFEPQGSPCHAPRNPTIAFTANYLWLRQTRNRKRVCAANFTSINILWNPVCRTLRAALSRRNGWVGVLGTGRGYLLTWLPCAFCRLPGCRYPVDEYLNCLYCWWISAGCLPLPFVWNGGQCKCLRGADKLPRWVQISICSRWFCAHQIGRQSRKTGTRPCSKGYEVRTELQQQGIGNSPNGCT